MSYFIMYFVSDDKNKGDQSKKSVWNREVLVLKFSTHYLTQKVEIKNCTSRVYHYVIDLVNIKLHKCHHVLSFLIFNHVRVTATPYNGRLNIVHISHLSWNEIWNVATFIFQYQNWGQIIVNFISDMLDKCHLNFIYSFIYFLCYLGWRRIPSLQ